MDPCHRAEHEARHAGVAELVHSSELVPRPELLGRLVQADVLLLPSLRTDANALPMKLFEYVGGGRPILLFGPGDHLAARLVTEHGLDVVVPDAGGLAILVHDFSTGATACRRWAAGTRAPRPRDERARPPALVDGR